MFSCHSGGPMPSLFTMGITSDELKTNSKRKGDKPPIQEDPQTCQEDSGAGFLQHSQVRIHNVSQNLLTGQRMGFWMLGMGWHWVSESQHVMIAPSHLRSQDFVNPWVSAQPPRPLPSQRHHIVLITRV